MISRMTMVTPPSWGPPNNPFAGPSNWIPPGPGIIGGDYDLFPNFPGKAAIRKPELGVSDQVRPQKTARGLEFQL